MFDRHLLVSNVPLSSRADLITTAFNEVGIREATGHNDGVAVERYLKVVHLKKGYPWCAAFISWVYAKQGFKKPNSAWSPDLFPVARRTVLPLPGDVMGVYFPALKRIAHVGLVEKIQADWVYTIEGNTNISGGAEGDGVYRRMRHLKSIRVFANWVGDH
jgi:hypothetical protein